MALFWHNCFATGYGKISGQLGATGLDNTPTTQHSRIAAEMLPVRPIFAPCARGVDCWLGANSVAILGADFRNEAMKPL